MSLIGVAIGPAIEAGVRALRSSLSHRGEVLSTRVPPIATFLHEERTLARAGEWCVAFDGLLFDAAATAARYQLPAGATNAALVAAVVRAQGPEGLTQLCGEFAVAILEMESRKLFLARDPLGMRPLFFGSSRDAVFVGSEPSGLRRALGGGVRPNRLALSQFLLGVYGETSITLDERISAVPPGCIVSIDGDLVSTKRYFFPRAIAPPRPDDLIEDFRESLRRAVRRRIDAETWFEVSGGLDSSAVAVTGSDLLGRKVHLATASFPGLACDETAEVRELAGLLDADLAAVDPRDHPASFDSLVTARAMPDVYFVAYRNLLEPVWRRVAELGGRNLVTGFGADQYLRRVPAEEVAESLRRGAWRAALRASLVGARLRRPLWSVHTFLGGARRAALPERVPRSGRRGSPPWMDEPCAQTAWDAVAQEHESLLRNIDGEVNRLLAWTTFGPETAFALVRSERHQAWVGVRRRHPFLDVDLIQKVLGYPQEERAGTALAPYKPLLRRAFGARLPAAMSSRVRRTMFGPFIEWWWVHAHRRLQDLMTRSRLADLQLIAPRRIPRITSTPLPNLRLLDLFALEEWLRACESEPDAR